MNRTPRHSRPAPARRILAGGTRLTPLGAVQLLEVYPYATLARLGADDAKLRPRQPGEDERSFISRVLERMVRLVDGLDAHADALARPHATDALVAAYTGWLGPDRLEAPPPGFNQASGWIWLPAAAPTIGLPGLPSAAAG